jgi:hypothetical protein
VTTQWSSLTEILRGTDSWTPFVAPTATAAASLVTQSVAILGTTLANLPAPRAYLSVDSGTIAADANGSVVSVSTSDYQGSGSGFSVVMRHWMA